MGIKMKKSSIGYRLKFDCVNPEEIDKFVYSYQKLFDRFEIKVTKNLISSGTIQNILNVAEIMAVGRFSIHVFKDALKNLEEYSMMVHLIKILRKYEGSDEVYLVTHIPYGNLSNYLPKVLEISRQLPKNYILLLENIALDSNNEDYLKQINHMCYLLGVNNIRNVGICLDIGHLLFGCYRENISEGNILSKLQEMRYILAKVKEIHIHDYMEQDHLQLKSGLMNLNLVSDFIKRNELNVPIIIEVAVKNPREDGIEQINIVERLLSKT